MCKFIHICLPVKLVRVVCYRNNRDMGKIAIALLLFCSLILPAPAYHGVPRDPESVADWFDNQIYKTEKLTKLHFFIHHEVSGKNPTALEVVRPNKTHGRFDFGVVVMFDDGVTVGPERDSTEIGRIQGSFSSAGLNEVSLMNNFLLFLHRWTVQGQ